MTRDSNLFATLSKCEGGTVTFGDNGKGKIIGISSIGKKPSPILEDVLLVVGLKANLISVSQLCDKGLDVVFRPYKCLIINSDGNNLFEACRNGNVYTFDFNDLSNQSVKCLAAVDEDPWLWHKRLGHVNFDLISKLSSKGLVRGLPNLKKPKEVMCDECKKNKQVKSSFHSKNEVSTSKPFQLLHMNLFGPMSTSSLNEKYYVFMIVDDFSRFTWILFLSHKNEAFDHFTHLCNKVEKEFGFSIIKIFGLKRLTPLAMF